MDYSKIDWSKLPELPGGRTVSVTNNQVEVVIRGTSISRMISACYSWSWAYLPRTRKELEADFAATDIIDRFIAEQEAELSKPKPRRVTPNELLVELIQTGKPIRVRLPTQTEYLSHRCIKWTEHGMRERYSDSAPWLDAQLEWFYNFHHFDILDTPEPPKPRLPVKTRAPEGCEWVRCSDGALRLRTPDGYLTNAQPSDRAMAEMWIAAGNAYLELNP